jgi:hypothetical protein
VSAGVMSMWQMGVGPWSLYEPDRSGANHYTVNNLGSERDWDCLESYQDCKQKSPETLVPFLGDLQPRSKKTKICSSPCTEDLEDVFILKTSKMFEDQCCIEDFEDGLRICLKTS